MYGDHSRSPGRDDRQDGAGAGRPSWDTGTPQRPAAEDLKVAGSPITPPPEFKTAPQGAGPFNTGDSDASGFDAGTTAAMPRPEGTQPAPGSYSRGEPLGQGPLGVAPGHDAGTAAMPAQQAASPVPQTPAAPTPAQGIPRVDPDRPVYTSEGATAMPPGDGAGEPPYGHQPGDMGIGGAHPPMEPDFASMRRKPRFSADKKVVRIAVIAAATVVVVGGGLSAWALTSGSGGTTVASGDPQVRTSVPAPAPLTDAQRKDAEDKRRKELKARAKRAAREEVGRPTLFAKGSPPPTKKPSAPPAGDPVPAGEAQRIARDMLSDFGWSPSSQFGCLVNLWNRESGWRTNAASPTGAYGIPQALPGSKMASAGPDWQSNAHTQIKWGLGYIKSRYGTPCGAWAHSQATGWY